MTYERLNTLLKTEGDYSEHSIKRGAMYVLLTQGAPLETIRVMAKHQNMKTMLAYLRPVDVVGRHGTLVASRLL
jgi:hypothetical protein